MKVNYDGPPPRTRYRSGSKPASIADADAIELLAHT
jgi:hypothetical protein